MESNFNEKTKSNTNTFGNKEYVSDDDFKVEAASTQQHQKNPRPLLGDTWNPENECSDPQEILGEMQGIVSRQFREAKKWAEQQDWSEKDIQLAMIAIRNLTVRRKA